MPAAPWWSWTVAPMSSSCACRSPPGSARRAGIPNKVVALRNGTMGWELAGFRCEHGRSERFASGAPKTATIALKRAQAFAENSGVGVIGAIDLARFEDDPDRTLYVLDVR